MHGPCKIGKFGLEPLIKCPFRPHLPRIAGLPAWPARKLAANRVNYGYLRLLTLISGSLESRAKTHLRLRVSPILNCYLE